MFWTIFTHVCPACSVFRLQYGSGNENFGGKWFRLSLSSEELLATNYWGRKLIQSFHKLCTIQECQDCHLCFSCAIWNLIALKAVFVTARARSTRRSLCFNTCVSVQLCKGGGGGTPSLSHYMSISPMSLLVVPQSQMKGIPVPGGGYMWYPTHLGQDGVPHPTFLD